MSKLSVFNKGVVSALAGVALFAATASTATAAIITIGLQEATFNGGAITTVAGPGVGTASFSGAYGSFPANILSGLTNPLVTGSVNGKSIDGSRPPPGVIPLVLHAA